MAKTLLVLNEQPYGGERSYNGLRMAIALLKTQAEEVRVFLMGDAAACAKQGQKVPQGYYNIADMLGMGRGAAARSLCAGLAWTLAASPTASWSKARTGAPWPSSPNGTSGPTRRSRSDGRG